MTFAFSVNDVFKINVNFLRTAIIKCTLTHISSLTDETDAAKFVANLN